MAYYEDELIGESAEEQDDPRIEQALAVSQPDQTLLSREVAARAQDIHKKAVERTTQQQLDSGTLDQQQLQQLAQRYGAPPEPEDVEDAVVEGFNALETEGRRAELDKNLTRFKADRERNSSIALKSIQDRIKVLEVYKSNRDEVRNEDGTINVGKSTFRSTGRTILEWIDQNVLFGQGTIDLTRIVRDVAPELYEGVFQYVQPGDALNALPRVLASANPVQSKKILNKLITSIHKHSGSLRSDNITAEKDLLDQFAYLLKLANKGDRSILPNIFAPIDFIGAGLDAIAVKGAAKLVTKAARDGARSLFTHTPGSLAERIEPFIAGSDLVAKAATNADVAVRTGIPQVQAIGSNLPRTAAIAGSDVVRASPAPARQLDAAVDDAAEEVARLTPEAQAAAKARVDEAARAANEARVRADRAAEDVASATDDASRAAAQSEARAAEQAAREAEEALARETAEVAADRARFPEGEFIQGPGPAVRGGASSRLGDVIEGTGRAADDLVREAGDTPLTGTPFFDEYFLEPAARAAKTDKLNTWLQTDFKLRLNDSRIDLLDKGQRVSAVFGNSNGTGWINKLDADEWAKLNLDDGTYTIQQDRLGGWNAVYKQDFNYLSDEIGSLIDGIQGIGLGKASRYSRTINIGSTQADIISSQALTKHRKLLKSIRSLGKKKADEVMDVLERGHVFDNGNGTFGKEFTSKELRNMGLNPKQVKAYEDARELVRQNLTERNLHAREELFRQGYKTEIDLPTGEIAYARTVTPDLAGRFGRVMDYSTGRQINIATSDMSAYRTVQLFEDTESGFSYAAIRIGVQAAERALPGQVLKAIPGLLLRRYTSPIFVREVLPNGVTRAEATAGSLSRGEAEVARLKAQFPDREFRTFRASEARAAEGTLDELAALREQGLMRTSHRNPLSVRDVDGVNRLDSVYTSLEKMANSTATAEGIGRWGIAMKEMLFNTYGKALGIEVDLARAPVRPAGTVDERLWKDFMSLYNYTHLVLGTHPTGPVGAAVRSRMTLVTDFFYNFGGKPGAILSNELTGLTSNTTRALKTAAFVKYLAFNPIVQIPLQALNATQYLGVRGAAGYALKGAWLRDSAILQFSNMPGAIDFIAKATGTSMKYARELIRDYNASGRPDSISNHLMVAGSLSDARVATPGILGKAATGAMNTAKSVGMDVGVSVDKRAAWLIARNRHLHDGGALDREGLKKIATDSEALTGSLNRSDPLVNPTGAMSFVLQFLSQPLKMANRAVGGTVGAAADVLSGGRAVISKEDSLSRREQAQIAVVSALSWGFGGYGFSELIDKLDEKHGWGLEQEHKEVLREGLAGSVINFLFRAQDDPNELDRYGDNKRTDLLVSTKYSPFSFAGQLLTNGADFGKLVITGNFDQLQEMLPNPAAAGVVGDTKRAFTFWGNVAGLWIDDQLTDEEARVAASAEFLRQVPVTNNWVKYQMALNTGMSYSRSGKASVELAEGERLAALLGLRTTQQHAVDVGFARLLGRGGGEATGGEAKQLEEEAKAQAKWLIPMLRDIGTPGAINRQDAAKRIIAMHVTFKDGLQGNYRLFRDKLMAEIDKADIPSSHKLMEQITEGVLSGEIAVTESFKSKFDGLDIARREEVQRVINSLYDQPTQLKEQ